MELRPALDFDLPFLAELFNRSFVGYFFPVSESPEGLAARLRYDTIDLALSRVAFSGDRAVGIVYVSVRGWSCRIAGMGVVPEARRCGVGRALMGAAIARTRALGCRGMVLEVIEQNAPALELYRGLGFEARRRLVGYEHAGEPEMSDGASRRDADRLAPADPRAVARQVALAADPDLPWQLAPETLAAYGPPVRGFHLNGKTWALVYDPGSRDVILYALIVPRAHRRAGWGSRLARALLARYAGRSWRIPARVPEGLADGFLTGLGFRRVALSQLEMGLELQSDAR